MRTKCQQTLTCQLLVNPFPFVFPINKLKVLALKPTCGAALFILGPLSELNNIIFVLDISSPYVSFKETNAYRNQTIKTFFSFAISGFLSIKK